MDDEEEFQDEQGQEQEQGGQGYGVNNFVSRISNDANGVADNANKAADVMGKMAEKQTKKAAEKSAQAAAKAGTKAGAKAAKGAAQAAKRAKDLAKAASKASALASSAQGIAAAAAALAEVIAIIAIVILIILVIIGLTVFIITGWGMIMDGLKGIATEFWDSCVGLFNGNETVVHDDEVVDLMDSLEEMGYDLYGYGFVTSRMDMDDDDKYYDAKITKNEETGVETTSDVKLKPLLKDVGAYRNLMTYLVSDNYAYYIKNHNFNFKSQKEDVMTFFGGMFDRTLWGSGLISIYKQKRK